MLYSSDRVPRTGCGRSSISAGATLPEVPPATTGAVRLASDAGGLQATPATVLAHYTDLLNRGTASVYGAEFSPDQFRTELYNQLGTDRAAVASIGVGTVMAVHTVPPGPVFALATVDGGALVIGRADQSTRSRSPAAEARSSSTSSSPR